MRFHVLPRGSICVLLSSDLNVTVRGWRDCFQQWCTRSPHKHWCLFMRKKLTRTWLNTLYVLHISNNVHKRSIMFYRTPGWVKSRLMLDILWWNMTTAGGTAHVWIPRSWWCMIEMSTSRVAINQWAWLIWSCYSWELNRLWDCVNLPVSFCWFFPSRLSVWYLFCFSVYPVTAESFNWVTTVSPPWIAVLGSVWLVMLSCILSSQILSPPDTYTSNFTLTPPCTQALPLFHLVWEYKWSISKLK